MFEKVRFDMVKKDVTVTLTSVVVCAWTSPYPTEAEVAAAQ